MRALLSTKAGGPETLEIFELANPEAGPGQIAVDVKACAINYPDVLIIEDRYQVKPPRPFAPGGEVAGVVASVGTGVKDWRVGDRIMGVVGHGGLAEKLVVAPEGMHRLPAERSFVEGAALILTYSTTLHALVDRARLKEGEHMLVMGAAGGVGLAAIELGKALGARVTAAVSSSEKAAIVRSAGADEVIVYPRGPFEQDEAKALSRMFKDAGGASGFQVVYDPVGGAYTEAALRAIAWAGRFLVIGFPAGIPRIPLNLALLKGCDILGVFWGAAVERDLEAERQRVEYLFALWTQGRISPRVTDIYPFAEGGRAIAKMSDRGAIGKLVVDLSA